jgi:hypothetical protein
MSSPGLTGRSSTPRLIESIITASGILGRPVRPGDDTCKCVGVNSIFKQSHDTASRSRRVNFFARGIISSSPPWRGRGNAGRLMHPQTSYAQKQTNGRSHHRYTRTPGAPHAMVLQLLRALLGEPGFLATVALRIKVLSAPGRADSPPKGLTPASGCQDHTTLLYAAPRLRQRLRRA